MNDRTSRLLADDFELELGQLLSTLSTVQSDLLSVLSEKRERMADNDLVSLAELNSRAADLCTKLESCHDWRLRLLAQAEQKGISAQNLAKLTEHLPRAKREDLGKQVKSFGPRMRLLQHQCLTNWVLAQRSLLHVSQLLEIIASGGRIQPTYGTGAASLSRGALIDGEA